MLKKTFILWRILQQKIFLFQTWHKYISSRTCFIGGEKKFLSAKQPIVNSKGRFMSAEILFYYSLGQILYKVMSNEIGAAETSLLHDQKHHCINFHLGVFW